MVILDGYEVGTLPSILKVSMDPKIWYSLLNLKSLGTYSGRRLCRFLWVMGVSITLHLRNFSEGRGE
jgi:hypothetical protein